MAMVTQLIKGGKFSPDLLVYGLGAGVTAIGGYNAFWDLLFPADKQAKPSLEGAEVLAKADSAKEKEEKKDPTDPNLGGGAITGVIFFLISGSGLLVYLITLSGCANSVDGLRQACSNADAVLTSGYQTTASLYKAKQEHLRSTLTPTNVEQVKATLAQDSETVGKVFAALDAATAAKKGVCELAPAIEAGAKKDIPVLVGKLLQIGLDVRNVVTDLQKLSP
jgi:molecular chaperone DnaK (HSP70)